MDEKHFWAAMLSMGQKPPRGPLGRALGAVERILRSSPPDRARIPASPASFHRAKFCLGKGLHAAALIERIRDATQRGQPLGEEAFVKWVRERSKAQLAQTPADPPETELNLEMAAT